MDSDTVSDITPNYESRCVKCSGYKHNFRDMTDDTDLHLSSVTGSVTALTLN